MTLTKNAIGNLINRYKAVLAKCRLLNTLGTLAVAGALVLGGAGMAAAANSGIDYKAPPDYVGKYTTSGHATGGAVTIDSDEQPGWSVYGGRTMNSSNYDNANGNSITMTNGHPVNMYGGYSKGGNADSNSVTISGGGNLGRVGWIRRQLERPQCK